MKYLLLLGIIALAYSAPCKAQTRRHADSMLTPAIPPPSSPAPSEEKRWKGAFNLQYEDGYIDMESVRNRHSYVEFWVKLFPNPKYLSIVRDRENKKVLGTKLYGKYNNYAYQLIKYQMKCDEDKFRAMTFTDYATDGESIRSSSREETPWNPIVPESNGELMEKIICQ